MKTLQVFNGDLVLNNGGSLQFVQGNNKLVQDLALWLKEPYGTGTTTPSFGSTLVNMVGQPDSSVLVAQVQNEVSRVLNLYRSQQLLNLQNAQTSSQLSFWNKSEIINTINSIQVSPNITSIIIYVNITTLAGSTVSLSLTAGPNGIQVSNG